MLSRPRVLISISVMPNREEFMRIITFLLFFLVPHALSAADIPGLYPAGIVYGPKAAFKISAPDGWVVNNYSGVSQGLHCVLYPKGGSWDKSKVVMYAKIASPKYPEISKFIEFTVNYFKADDSQFTSKIVDEGETTEGYKITVNEYNRPSYPLYEQTAYIQLPEAVAYIVYSAPSKELRISELKKFKETVNSFVYVPENIQK